MNAVTKIKLDKKDYVILSLDDYEDLIDIVKCHEFQRKLAAGEEEFFPSELLDKILDNRENPVKVYREYRQKTIEEACAATGISKDYWKKIEKGVAVGSVGTLKKIARFLNVDMEMLTPCED
jgi:DNA-binding XRE family transcriptional regulator